MPDKTVAQKRGDDVRAAAERILQAQRSLQMLYQTKLQKGVNIYPK